MPLTDFFSSNNNYNEKITIIVEAKNITIIELTVLCQFHHFRIKCLPMLLHSQRKKSLKLLGCLQKSGNPKVGEAHPEPSETSKMDFFMKVAVIPIFTKKYPP